MADPQGDDVEALVAELGAAGRYTSLAPELLERTARWALERHPRRKDAAKAARRKLHQVYGAFVSDRALTRAAGAAERLGEADLREVCREVLRCHTSTAEREPYVENFYAAAFDGLPAPATVTDLGAGLNAFALPWMPLGDESAYAALDVDPRFAELTRRLAPHVAPRVTAGVGDLVAGDGPVAADVVLLLKTLPTVEQQARGAAARLLGRIEAGRVVVSFSARSLTGREKGMPENYERMLDGWIGSRWRRSERIAFATETLYHLHR